MDKLPIRGTLRLANMTKLLILAGRSKLVVMPHIRLTIRKSAVRPLLKRIRCVISCNGVVAILIPRVMIPLVRNAMIIIMIATKNLVLSLVKGVSGWGVAVAYMKTENVCVN